MLCPACSAFRDGNSWWNFKQQITETIADPSFLRNILMNPIRTPFVSVLGPVLESECNWQGTCHRKYSKRPHCHSNVSLYSFWHASSRYCDLANIHRTRDVRRGYMLRGKWKVTSRDLNTESTCYLHMRSLAYFCILSVDKHVVEDKRSCHTCRNAEKNSEGEPINRQRPVKPASCSRTGVSLSL